MVRDFKRQSLQNALLIAVLGDRKRGAIWRLNKWEVGGQTICLQSILAQMSCGDVLQCVGEEVLKEYNNLHHKCALQKHGNRGVHCVGEESCLKAAIDRAGSEGGPGVDDDDDEDEPAETALCAFVANNLHKGGNPTDWQPLQQRWKKREKKEPCRVGDPPLSFGEFIRAHPHGCFVCYGKNSSFQQDHWTYPDHKVDREAYKKADASKKHAPVNVEETKVEVSRMSSASLRMGSQRRSRRSRDPGSLSKTRTRPSTRTRRASAGGRGKVTDSMRSPWTKTTRQTGPLREAPAAKGPG